MLLNSDTENEPFLETNGFIYSQNPSKLEKRRIPSLELRKNKWNSKVPKGRWV